MLLQVQYIRKKFNELDVFLIGIKYDGLTLNEHWLFQGELSLYITSGCKLGNISGRDNLFAQGDGSVIHVKQNIEAQS